MNPRLPEELQLTDAELEKQAEDVLAAQGASDIDAIYRTSIRDFVPDTIVAGRVISVFGNDVVVDIGYKSEGIVPLAEFGDPKSVKPGQDVEVFIEAVEDDAGLVALSKIKADRIRGWERIIAAKHEGDVVRGRVIRKIKGGLLVDIGVPVFLPASQVDIRRVEEIGDYIGREIDCKVIKIDEKRMNIIVSRRRMLEEVREEQKKRLMTELKEGEIRRGIVKNIADFGVFVDLGGIDGLLHITDMSWGRISHPSEMVAIDKPLDVKILKIDRTNERIALGIKQLVDNPWNKVPGRYPNGTRLKGKVVNILPYGAFVELEEGVEGLVHISEMSWTKRVGHPSEMVAIGDICEVIVLNIDENKQEISLGMKQTEVNPWTLVSQKYPVGTKIAGRVRNLTNYGAFVEIEEGIDGLLHVSDMSWTKKVMHPSEIVKKGDRVEATILSVDPDRKRVALGLKQMQSNPWDAAIPEKYKVGTRMSGKITKLTNFGAFVELEANLEGLLHVSKLSEKGEVSPTDLLKVNDVIEVEVIRLEPKEGKIGLAMVKGGEVKRAPEAEIVAAEKEVEAAAPVPPAV